MTILPFSVMFLMAHKGFIYTIAVHFYAFRLAFSTILPCILHQNALHLAAKRTAFCSKLPRNWCKWQSFQIKIHFAACTC